MQQRFFSEWLSDIANRRKHGTTGRQPEKVFLEAEKEKLVPLPVQDFIFSKSGSTTVHTNCHIVHKVLCIVCLYKHERGCHRSKSPA